MIVVVVQPALTHRHCAGSHVAANRLEVAHVIELRGVMGMDTRGVIDIPRVNRSDASGSISRGDRFSNGYDGRSTGIASASDHGVAVGIERRVREVSVAIDVVHTSEHRRDVRGGVVSKISGWRHLRVVDRAWCAALPGSRFS